MHFLLDNQLIDYEQRGSGHKSKHTMRAFVVKGEKDRSKCFHVSLCAPRMRLNSMGPLVLCMLRYAFDCPYRHEQSSQSRCYREISPHLSCNTFFPFSFFHLDMLIYILAPLKMGILLSVISSHNTTCTHLDISLFSPSSFLTSSISTSHKKNPGNLFSYSKTVFVREIYL